jgi:hypothetical protein
MQSNKYKLGRAAFALLIIILGTSVFAQGPACPPGPPPGFKDIVIHNTDTPEQKNDFTTGDADDVELSSTNTVTWTGVVSTNWFTAINWSPNKVPSTCSDTIVIPVGINNPVISNDNVTVGSITLAKGATINLQNSNLNICGYLKGPAHGSASISGSGIVILNGTKKQRISGILNISEVEINNNAGALLKANAQLNISNALDLQEGNFDVSQGKLTLQSNSVTQCAILDNFSAGNQGSLTGAITAQRYYSQALSYDSSYQHMMGSPVNNPPFSQFGDSGTTGYVIPMPDCDESRMATGSPYGHVFGYSEQAPGAPTCGVSQWRVETSGNAVNGQGYSIRKVGKGTLSLTGSPNLAESYTLTELTNSGWSNSSLQGRQMSGGWQLLSNPYSATLQLTTINAGFDNQIQIWAPEGPFEGTYQVEMVGDNAIVPPFQGFMVHKTYPSGTASYTINASDRVRTAATFYAQQDDRLQLIAENKQTGLLDQTTIAFDTRATNGFDPEFDAIKPMGAPDRHTLYSVNNTDWMAINVLHSISTTNAVALGFVPGVSGAYVLHFNGINTFSPGTKIFLEDKLLQMMYDITMGDYNFTASSTDNPGRFVLHFSAGVTTGISNDNTNQPEALHMRSYENEIYVYFTGTDNVNAVIKVYDVLGREISNEVFNSNTIYQRQLSSTAAGCVLVNVTNAGISETRKLFISGGN